MLRASLLLAATIACVASVCVAAQVRPSISKLVLSSHYHHYVPHDDLDATPGRADTNSAHDTNRKVRDDALEEEDAPSRDKERTQLPLSAGHMTPQVAAAAAHLASVNMSWLTCDLCEFAVKVVAKVFSTNMSTEVALDAARVLCEFAPIVGTPVGRISVDVCADFVVEYGPFVAYVVQHSPSADVCRDLGACGQPPPLPKGHSLEQLAALPASQPGVWPDIAPLNLSDPTVGTFVQVTDVHYDPLYAAGSSTACGKPICCRAAFGNGTDSSNTAGLFGAANCDVPAATVMQGFAAIAELDPDFVLLTGDYATHVLWLQTQAENAHTLTFVADALADALPEDIPVVPVFGNHDTYPINLFNGADQSLNDLWDYENAVSSWSQWLPASAKSTLMTGGYFSTVIRDGLRAIVINTQLGARTNFYLLLEDVNSADKAGQLAWLQRELKAARASKEKVLLLGHMPFWVPDFYASYADRLHALVEEYADIIVASFHGHTHNEQFYVARDRATDSRPVLAALVTSSLTTEGGVNPAFRRFFYNRTTFELIDYTHHVADLRQAAATGKLHFEESYSFRGAYGVSSLSAADVSKAFGRLASNSTLFDQYYKRYFAGAQPDMTCTGSCARRELCAIGTSTLALSKACAARSRVH